MTMGESIKHYRKQIGLTQEELESKLHPPVQRAAVNKWERGIVSNIKRSYIQQLASLFNVSPSELMCFDTSKGQNDNQLSQKNLTDQVKEAYGQTALDALALYTQLDSDDQGEIRGEMKQMLKASKYMEKDSWSARAG